MLEIITDITEGRGVPEQIDLLEELADTVTQTSLCGLGKTAANPVLSTLRYFREEYEAHIKGGKCPAGVCKALIEYAIDSDKCNGCGKCVEVCQFNAIELIEEEKVFEDCTIIIKKSHVNSALCKGSPAPIHGSSVVHCSSNYTGDGCSFGVVPYESPLTSSLPAP